MPHVMSRPAATAIDPATQSTRVAIVTGSTSGIGLAIAEALANAGFGIMLNGLGGGDEAEKLRAELASRHGVDVVYSAADMSSPAQIRSMLDLAHDRFGRVDVIVNNAGIQHVAAIEEFPHEKWDAILAINLASAFHTIRAAVPQMKVRRWGRIINVASAHALVASPFKSAYVAAKHGLLGLTKAVALETAEYAITCNAICPGYVLTPLVERQIPETARARGITEEQVVRDVLLHAQPTRRFVSAAEIGALAAFLCTDGAASITGAALPIEGGWTAQ